MEMKRLVLFSLALLLVLGFVQSLDFTDADLKSDKTKMALYDKWRAEFKKPEPSPEEKKKRFKAFKKNLENVDSTNKAGLPYTLKMNKFADLHHEEFIELFCGAHSRHGRSLIGIKGGDASVKVKTDAPPTVDWRTKNVVTPVKDQGQCDCDREMNKGCDGGVVDYAFTYVKKNGGLAAEKSYPYTNVAGTCSKEKMANKVAKIDSYRDVPMENEAALMKAVAGQPVVVLVDVSKDFQLYGEGVLAAEVENTLRHALVVVGYDDVQKFWILKNSWGEDWGEGGYVRVTKDSPFPWGSGGITLEASYPVIKDGNQPPKEEI